MASGRLKSSVGPIELRTPLIASSGTVGSVWEWAEVADVRHYGAAVAKSVAPTPWPGRPPPRLAPAGTGMLNGIGIQNPGIDSWAETVAPRLSGLDVPVWGSCVGGDPKGFAHVARRLASSGVQAIEVNLSCPNLDDGEMFSFDPDRSSEVIEAVASSVTIPVGAKLSPNTPRIVGVARACQRAGADFVVLTNTALGFGLSLSDRKPVLSGGVGGYSGPGLKAISMRCVYEVAQELPGLPIVGCGGVVSGTDVLEYIVAGASAVQLGTVLLAEPKAGSRITREIEDVMSSEGFEAVSGLVGSVKDW